jgi:hypothetical protein
MCVCVFVNRNYMSVFVNRKGLVHTLVCMFVSVFPCVSLSMCVSLCFMLFLVVSLCLIGNIVCGSVFV